MIHKIRLDEDDIAEILAKYFQVSRDKVRTIWCENTQGYGMNEHQVMEFAAEVEIPVSRLTVE